MLQISFKAGYGDPTRTIWKKYQDFASINAVNTLIGKEIEELQAMINDLILKRDSLIQRFTSNPKPKKELEVNTDIQSQVEELNDRIKGLKQRIKKKEDSITDLYYSYHERL